MKDKIESIIEQKNTLNSTTTLYSVLREDCMYEIVSSQIPDKEHAVENALPNSSLSSNASVSFLFLLNLVLSHNFPDSPQNTTNQNNEHQHFRVSIKLTVILLD